MDTNDQSVESSKAQAHQRGVPATADTLARARGRLKLLANLMRNASLDLDSLLQQIIDDLGQALPQADVRVIYLYDERNQVLVPSAWAGYDAILLGRMRLKPGESISGRVYQTGQPSLTQTPAEVDARAGLLRPSSQRLYAQAIHGKTILSNICAPLRRPDHGIIGTITLSSTRAAFFQEDLELLVSVGNQIAQAIVNASLFSHIQANEANNRWLLENLPVGISENDQSGRILYQNPCALQITGYQPEDLQTLYVRDLFVDPGEYDAVLSMLPVRSSLVREHRLQRKDGRQIWVKTTWQTTRDESGTVVRYLVLLEDVTEARRQAEEYQALEQIREQVWRMESTADIAQVLVSLNTALRQVGVPFEHLSINTVHTTADGPSVRTHQLSPKGEWRDKSLQRGEETVKTILNQGKTVYRQDLLEKDIYQESLDLIHLFGQPVRSAVDVPFSHGTLALNSSQPDAFADSDIAFLEQAAGVLSDGFRRLDDLKELALKEDQLRQAQKMDAIGHLAGGVAHDFNNLITIISGYSQLLLHDLNEEDPRRLSAEEIHDASERAEKLVNQLLLFSRRKPAEPGPVLLNEAVEDLDKLFRRLIGEDIELSAVLDPDLDRVYADRGQLDQVIMNLAVNARDAMPTGGKLTIETANVELDAEQVRRPVNVDPGRYVMLAISDTGVGMDKETQSRIFEPFFTTKKHKGTGLGLAIVYGIVKQSKGDVWVYSEPGQGTTFKIYLPCCTATEEVEAPQPQEPTAIGGLETILLVEDDDMVRKLTCRFLDENGYRVLEARHGQEALEVCAEHQDSISLLLTDVVMPGMSGKDLAEQLTGVRPDLKVVYMSGYTDSAIEHHGVLKQGIVFLQKPFSANTLNCKVREVLDNSIN